MRLFGVVNVAYGDFHDGSEKRTASAHQVLCQSWDKWYGDSHNDSTSLRGPMLESCIDVSMVQDRSHISWRWRTRREAQKLHNSWNCCTNSRALPTGSTSDHSRHCWGGNWLWDMSAGSDGRIANAPCRSLHHDNALSDISVFTHQFLVKNQMAIIPHPTYSHNLAPCDFFLFPKMKFKLKGRRFDTTEEIQAESQRVLDTLIEKDFHEAFQKWRRRWDRCLYVGGNYFEGDGGR